MARAEVPATGMGACGAPREPRALANFRRTSRIERGFMNPRRPLARGLPSPNHAASGGARGRSSVGRIHEPGWRRQPSIANPSHGLRAMRAKLPDITFVPRHARRRVRQLKLSSRDLPLMHTDHEATDASADRRQVCFRLPALPKHPEQKSPSRPSPAKLR